MQYFKYILLSATLSCSTHTPLPYGENSVEGLVKKAVPALFAHDNATVTQILISRNEFKQTVYENFPESKQIPADEFWETFIVRRRDTRIGDMMKKFQGKQCRLIHVGTARKVATLRRIKLHYQIPIEFECNIRGSKKAWHEVESNLFGSIVEADGKFRWLNAFWD